MVRGCPGCGLRLRLVPVCGRLCLRWVCRSMRSLVCWLGVCVCWLCTGGLGVLCSMLSRLRLELARRKRLALVLVWSVLLSGSCCLGLCLLTVCHLCEPNAVMLTHGLPQSVTSLPPDYVYRSPRRFA
jgi:hypothetical protein